MFLNITPRRFKNCPLTYQNTVILPGSVPVKRRSRHALPQQSQSHKFFGWMWGMHVKVNATYGILHSRFTRYWQLQLCATWNSCGMRMDKFKWYSRDVYGSCLNMWYYEMHLLGVSILFLKRHRKVIEKWRTPSRSVDTKIWWKRLHKSLQGYPNTQVF